MTWLDCPLPPKPYLDLELADHGIGEREQDNRPQVWGDEGTVSLAQAIAAAYDPTARCRAVALDRLETERQARGAVIVPDDPVSEWQASWHAILLTYKIARGIVLSAAEQAQEAQLYAAAQLGAALDAAAAAIAARIGAMGVDEANVFDAATAPEWPAL